MVDRDEETKQEIKEKVTVQEVPINLELINNKLNYIINILENKPKA